MYVQVSHLLWLIFLWLELPWVLSAMADARSRCLLDGPVCDLLLKSHVRNLDDAVFFRTTQILLLSNTWDSSQLLRG